MKNYLKLLEKILIEGHTHSDRTGVGRISLYGEQLRFNMQDGFPLVTSRKIPYKGMIKETLWFIKGSTSNQELNDQGVKIWDQWAVREEHIEQFLDKHQNKMQWLSEQRNEVFDRDAIKEGLREMALQSIGQLYGAAWRNAPVSKVSMLSPEIQEEDIASDKLKMYREEFKELNLPEDQWSAFYRYKHIQSKDQLQELIVNLKKRPYSSRHIVSAWIPEWVPYEEISPEENVLLCKGALAACHCMFQCFVVPPQEGQKPKLNMLLYIRSNDFPVGNPYNVSQYALLLHMLAQVCDYEANELIVNMGDVHIYSNQVEGVQEQLKRQPLKLPTLKLNPEIKDIYQFKFEDIEIVDYEAHPTINYPVAK